MKSEFVRAICCAVSLASCLTSANAQDKADKALREKLQDPKSERVRVFVEVTPSTNAVRAFRNLRQLDGPVTKDNRGSVVNDVRNVGASAALSLANSLEESYGNEKIQVSPEQFWLTSGFRADVSPDVIPALLDNDRVVSVVLDERKHAGIPELSPTDQAVQPSEWNVNLVGAPQVWQQGLTGEGIVIAIIDTGVDATHDGFEQRIYKNPDEVSGDGVDNDSNGFIDDMHGWDFVNSDNDPSDDQGHGTHCAGTAAGGRGFGVAKNAQIMPIKVLDEVGAGFETDAILGVQYAVLQGADVISISAGWFRSPHRARWNEVLTNLEALGVVTCVAAGNEGSIRPIRSPGEQTLALTVGAVDGNRNVTAFSSRGPVDLGTNQAPNVLAKPDLSAPGLDIRSFKQTNAYAFSSGTSMATPHVAGAVAILKQAFPTATSEQLKKALIASCKPPATENETGAGTIWLPTAIEILARPAGN